jgi:thiol-disulfide isomerase/thioredoxin
VKQLLLALALASIGAAGAMKPARLEDLKTDRLTTIDYAKKTVITFVQPGCIPCKNQLNALKCVQAKMGDNITVLAVQATGDSGELQRGLKPLRLTFPVLKGSPAYLKSYEADQTPTPMTAIIAAGGVVTDRILGAQSCEYWVDHLQDPKEAKTTK